MSVLGGGLLSGVGAAISGIFGGSRQKYLPHAWPDRYQRARVTGAPMANNAEANRVYDDYEGRGLMISEADLAAQGGSYRQQGQTALSGFQQALAALASQFGTDARGSLGGYTGQLRDLAARIRARGEGLAGGVMSGAMGLDESERVARSVPGQTDRYLEDQKRQINADYDVAGERGAGRIIGNFFGRGLGKSTIASGAASQFAGETERARSASLLGAEQSALDRWTAAQNNLSSLLATNAMRRAELNRTAGDILYRSDAPEAAAYSAEYGGEMDILSRVLGMGVAGEEAALSRLAPAGVFYPDPTPDLGSGGMYSAQGSGLADAFGGALGGVGGLLLGRGLGGGGGGGGGAFGDILAAFGGGGRRRGGGFSLGVG